VVPDHSPPQVSSLVDQYPVLEYPSGLVCCGQALSFVYLQICPVYGFSLSFRIVWLTFIWFVLINAALRSFPPFILHTRARPYKLKMYLLST